jgi:16S rRNA (adenine1518-N6/adenine1519-N6)-dimethyltransferase
VIRETPAISKNGLLFELKKHNISPTKKLGQNFLYDKNILEKIIRLSEIKHQDTVIEIGAGTGLLTRLLARECKKIIAIEKDERLIPLLSESTKAFPNVEICSQDFFKINFDCIKEEVKVIGNLPYNIASKIILNLLKKNLKIKDLTFLVQKELAERLTAKSKTKDYGSLTMLTDFLTDKKEILFDVSEKVFVPAPKVKSSLIKIRPKILSEEESEALPVLEKFLLFLFSMRRKKIKTSFLIFFQKNIKCTLGKKELGELLQRANIDGDKRVEEFEVNTVATFIIKYIL